MLQMHLVPMEATKVGVAPGTTTIAFGNADWCPYPVPGGGGGGMLPGAALPTASGSSQAVVLDPYSSIPDMKGALGLTPTRGARRTGRPSGPASAIRVPNRMMRRRKARANLGLVDPNEAWNTASLDHVHGTTTLRKSGGQWRISDVTPAYGTPWSWPPMNGALGGASLGITTGEVNRNLSGRGLGDEVIERLGPVVGGLGHGTINRLSPLGEHVIENRGITLGTTPNDDGMAIAYGGCYTPVQSGWVYGTRPNGQPYYESGIYGALGDATEDGMLKVLKTQTVLQALSALAVAALATVSVMAAVKAHKVGL